jgi:hypothetical protein
MEQKGWGPKKLKTLPQKTEGQLDVGFSADFGVKLWENGG